MRINHNISALKANNQLGKTNSALDKSLERLTSGYRINRAADDAAGMSISRKMQTQIAGLEQASRNASDGISVIQTAEGAVGEVSSILQRMRELSVQAANGTNTLADRESIQEEINQLNDEIQRIADQTEFNTKTLLNGDIDNKSFSDVSSVQLVSISDAIDPQDYSLLVERDPRQAVMVGDSGSMSDPIEINGAVCINNQEVVIRDTDTPEEVYEKVRDLGDMLNIDVFAWEGTLLEPGEEGYDASTAGYVMKEYEAGDQLVFVSREYGAASSIEIYCDDEELSSALGLSMEAVSTRGVDAVVSVSTEGGFASTATTSSNGNIVTITDAEGFEMKVEIAAGTAGTTFTDAAIDSGSNTASVAEFSDADVDETDDLVTISVLDAGPMVLQIGANTEQSIDVRIPEISPKTLGIDFINVCTEESASKAISQLDEAIATVTAVRSKMGAYQNRLEHSITNLDTSAENMTEAYSRIADTDMAREMTIYTQENVLSQAGVSMLAQANERPQTVLTLLQG